MAFWFLKGRTYIGNRDANGNPAGLLSVGCVDGLSFSFDVTTREHQENCSGENLTDLRIETGKSAGFKTTLTQASKANLELVVRGKTTDVAGGSVTDEVIVPTAEVGRLYLLKHQKVASVVITDSTPGTPKTLPSGQYKLNPAYGSLILNDITAGGPYVEPFKASYSYTASVQVAMMAQPSTDRWVRFEGINKADNNNPMLIDFYRVSLSPAKEISLIGDQETSFDLEGAVLYDDTKATDTVLGQFGRIVDLA